MLAINPVQVQPIMATPVKTAIFEQHQRILQSKAYVLAKVKELDLETVSDSESTSSVISIHSPAVIAESARADISLAPSSKPASIKEITRPSSIIAAPAAAPVAEKKSRRRKFADKVYALDWSMVELAAGQLPGKCMNPNCTKCLKEAEYKAKMEAKMEAKAAQPKEKSKGRKLASKIFTIDWSLIELAAGIKPAGVCVNPKCSKCLAEKRYAERKLKQ